MHETITELNKRKLINDMAKFALSGLISEKIFKYAAINGINLHFTFSHPAAKSSTIKFASPSILSPARCLKRI